MCGLTYIRITTFNTEDWIFLDFNVKEFQSKTKNTFPSEIIKQANNSFMLSLSHYLLRPGGNPGFCEGALIWEIGKGNLRYVSDKWIFKV